VCHVDKFTGESLKPMENILTFDKVNLRNCIYMDYDLTALTEDDIHILDFIINTSLEKGRVFTDDLPPLEKKTSLDNQREIKYTAYQHFLDILSLFEVVKIDKNLSNLRIEPIEVKTKNFQRNGGFKAIYDKQLHESARKRESDELYFKKLKWDSKISKWQVKTFWWIFMLALIGGVYSLVDFTKNLIDKNQEQVTKSQFESELSKLRTLILNQKVPLDTLNHRSEISNDSIKK